MTSKQCERWGMILLGIMVVLFIIGIATMTHCHRELLDCPFCCYVGYIFAVPCTP